MSDSEYDFVVIGAGIVGSWTAKHLSQHGRVLLLEQFREPHTRGSSHGQTRIIRSGYEKSYLADMMPHAYKLWRQAQAEMNEKLLETTGIIGIANSPSSAIIEGCVSNMKRLCPEQLAELSGKDLKLMYSSKLNYAEDCGVILDKTGGVLFAHKAVRTIQEWFKNSGGIMWDCCKVHDIIPSSNNKVKVCTGRGDVFAKSVVVSTGTWTKDFLKNLAPSLPLQPKRVKVFYWKEKETGAYSAASQFPCVLDFGPPEVYSLPSLEYPGLVKLCVHAGIPCDPDDRDKGVKDPKLENLVKEYVKKHFPLLEPEPSIIETCMYTCTPDETFLIDTVPGHKNIAIGTGFSGIGFKTSPVVGKLLSELARGVEPFLDISPYRLSRFSSN